MNREKGDIVRIFLNRFVNLMDNPIDKTQYQDGDEVVESERDRQHFDKEFMKAYIEDLKERGRLLIVKIFQMNIQNSMNSCNICVDTRQIDKKLTGEAQFTL